MQIPVSCPLLAMLTLGCAIGESTATRFTATDSAGVELQVSTASQWEEGAGWRLAAEPTLQIGALDGAPEYLFDRISDVRPLNDGGILAVNGGTAEIRIYDASGAHVRTMGRQGEGPGEFQGIASVVAQGDSLLVFDNWLRRISIFGNDGKLRGTITLTGEGGGRALMTYRLADASPAGNVLIARGGFLGMTNTPGVRRDTVPTLLYGTDGMLLDTIAEYTGTYNFEVPQQVVGPILFASSSSGTARDGRIYMTDGGSMEVRVYGTTDGLQRILRIVEAPRPVSAAAAAALKARRLERAAEMPAQFRDALEQWPHAEHMPRIQGMLLDDEGNLWVDEYRENADTASHVSYVFAPDGRWLGTVQMPAQFELRAVSRGQAIGVWKDPDTDVQYVRTYDLIR
jgi:hypothetical protein